MVIPAILAKSKKEFTEKIKRVHPYAKFIQIDVMDGFFVPNKTWADPAEIKKMKMPKYEVHLMVKDIEEEIKKWAGADRIIFHIEATKNPEKCIKEIKKLKKQVGMAINPETPVAKIKKFLSQIDHVLVMGVNPGFSGQKFQPKVLSKIKKLRLLAPNIKIGVDGGVDKTNAKKLYSVGADTLCAASSIFKSKNVRNAIDELGSE